MNFYEWLLFNENVETNFNDWLETLIQYAKTSDWEIIEDSFYAYPRHNNSSPGVYDYLRELVGKDRKQWTGHHHDLIRSSTFIKENIKNIIKTVLKEKNLENFNWFSFSIGYLGAKNNYFKEDLELAINVAKQRIDSGELPKTEIGTKGWLRVGYESKDKVQEYLQSQQQVSNRQLEKMKKSGMSLDENENLIKLVVQADNIKIYHLPALKSVDNIKERHLLLCKYGKGTAWCTAQPSWDAHTHYTGNNIYIIHVDDKPKYQFVGCKDVDHNRQFMNKKDEVVEELEDDVYDALAANLSDQFSCYNMARKASLTKQQLADLMKINKGMGESYCLGMLVNGREIPDEIVVKLIKDSSVQVDQEISKAKKTSSKALTMLYDKYKDSDTSSDNDASAQNYTVLLNIAGNPNIEKSLLSDMFKKHYNPKDDWNYSNDGEIIDAIAFNPSTPPEFLIKIAKEDNYKTDKTYFVSNNPSAPPELLSDMFEKGRDSVLSNPNVPEKLIRMVVNSERMGPMAEIQKQRLRSIARNEKCPSDILDKLSTDTDYEVKESVIYNRNTKIETLKKMLNDTDRLQSHHNSIGSLAKSRMERRMTLDRIRDQ
jgi:hypothetical protein